MQRRAVRDGLAQLAHRDLAVGHEDGARHAGLRRVGRGARARVAGARADDGPGAVALGDRDGGRHPAVLERRGRVEALVLHEDVGPGELRELLARDEGRPALLEGDDGRPVEHRQPGGVLADHPAPQVRHGQAPSTRITDATSSTASRSARASTVAASAASVARWVTTMSLARLALARRDLLAHRLDRDVVLGEGGGDLREHARAVGDVEADVVAGQGLAHVDDGQVRVGRLPRAAALRRPGAGPPRRRHRARRMPSGRPRRRGRRTSARPRRPPRRRPR